MKPFRQVPLESLSNNPGHIMPLPAILLTRPDGQSVVIADKLRQELGFQGDIIQSPLLKIEPTDERPDLSGTKGLIFTSKHGVMRFEQFESRRDLPCWCVGRSTGQAAERAGLKSVVAGGDAEALKRRILADAPEGPLLHLRGEQTRGDIAETLSAGGIETQASVVYRQVPKMLTNEAKTVLNRGNTVILPLFSPNTARQFVKQGPFSAPLFVVAISDNVAVELRGLDFAKLIVSPKPDVPSMLKAMGALIAASSRIEGGTGRH